MIITIETKEGIPYDLRVADRLDAEAVMDHLLREAGASDPATSDWETSRSLANGRLRKTLLGYATEEEALHDEDGNECLVAMYYEEG